MAGYGTYTINVGDNQEDAERLLQERGQLAELFAELSRSGLPGTERLLQEYNTEKRSLSSDGDWNEMSASNTVDAVMREFLDSNPGFLEENGIAMPGLNPDINLDPVTYSSMPESTLGQIGLGLGMAGFLGAAGAAAGGLTSALLPESAAGGGGSVGSWLGPATEGAAAAEAPGAFAGGLEFATALGRGALSSDSVFGEGGSLSVEPPKTDEDLDRVLSVIDDILLNANSQNPGTGYVPPDDTVSIFDPPQVPTIEEIADSRTEPTGNTDTPVSDPPIVPVIPGGVLDTPTQPPINDPTVGEGQNNDNTLLQLLALLSLGGAGSSTTNTVNDNTFRPNIPNSSYTAGGQPAFGDFDIPVHLPRLSQAQYRGKRLAMPEFML